MSNVSSICLLGFGEVGQALAADLSKTPGIRLSAYDVLFDTGSSAPAQGIEQIVSVVKCLSAAEAASSCDLVISAVTAAEVLVAADSVAKVISPGAYYLDLNSVSPKTRLQAADIIELSGGRFVEAAVMAPIEPKRLASPILLGGPHAGRFEEFGASLGFTAAKVFSGQVGPASATKMCRSVIIKGMEALFAESLVAARHYGVETDVVESLSNLLQVEDWQAQAHYMISRSIEHGLRRAEEMREVTATMNDADVDPLMSIACINRQEWAATFDNALITEELGDMLDKMLLNEDKTMARKTA